MQKKLFNTALLSLSIIGASLFTTSASYANNLGCLEQLKSRTQAYEGILTLNSCLLEDYDMQKVISYLKNNTYITHIFLNHNDLSSRSFAALADMQNITEIQAEDNQIGDAEAIAIAKNKSLRWVDLANNHIGDQGAAALAALPKLDKLDLSSNWIEDAGTQALAKNSSVVTLYLDNNRIGPTGAAAFAGPFNVSPKLIVLSLDNNYVGDTGAIAIAKHPTLTDFYLAANHITNVGATALANDMNKNSTLKWIELDHNDITDDGITAFVQNNYRGILDIRFNHLSDKGMKALDDANIAVSYFGNDGSDATMIETQTISSAKLQLMKTHCRKYASENCPTV